MDTPSIPLHLLRELRCRHCDYFVSSGPVFVVPDGAILCGRCHALAKNIYQNTSYEALASIFQYPCKNWDNHCPSYLRWDDIFEHENKCSFHGSCNLFWRHPKAFWKGKREVPLGDIRLITIPEYLLEYIKCVQCESYLSCEPVFIQPNGRNICHRCVHANGVPPNTVRNLSYEMLSNIIIFPCVFRNRGCPTRLKFGSDLWQHESQCSYNQMFQKLPPKFTNQKERGVIKTHSGHYYGTITPNTAPFSPPSPTTDFEVNEQLVKSLKKQQERRFLRAEEIETNIGKRSSEEESEADLEYARVNSYEKYSSSGESSPTRQTDNKQPTELQRESSYYSQTSSGNRTKNFSQNIYLAQVHQENSNSNQVSRNNSYNKQKSPTAFSSPKNNIEDYNKVTRNDSYNKPYSPTIDSNGVTRSSVTKMPYLNIDFSVLAGHYPVFGSQYEYTNFDGNGLVIPKPTFKELVRSESLSGNRELMEELKQKQNKMKKNIHPAESPYKECNNLEEVLQVHNEIGE